MAEIARLEIVLDDAGHMQVTGCIDNKMLAYGLLEIARDVVCQRAAAAEHRVQPATPGELMLVGGGKRN